MATAGGADEAEVLIVGAGLAGIAAAHTLIKEGFTKVQIVEATGRIGGRIYSVPFGESHVELGAQWLHGESPNPVYDLASGHSLVDTDERHVEMNEESGWFYTLDGERVDPKLTATVLEKSEEITEEMASAIYYSDEPHHGQSLGHFSQKHFNEFLLNSHYTGEQKKLMQGIFKWILWKKKLDNAVSNMDDMSLKYWGMYEEYPGNQLVPLKGKYQDVLEPLLVNIPPANIHLNICVVKIIWRKVQTIGEAHGKITVVFSDGRAIRADHVIFTCSLGCLKKYGLVMFDPLLPEWKLNAINKIGFGTVDKIFLQFKKPFWEQNCGGFCLVRPDEDDGLENCMEGLSLHESMVTEEIREENNNAPKWWMGIHGLHRLSTMDNVLCVWMVGDHAEAMEQVSDQEIINTCTHLMQKICRLPEKPEVTNIKRTAWFNNPFTLGSYAYPSVRCNEQDFEALQEPLPDRQDCRLLFAGEATDPKHASTTQAAMLSGHREAHRIVDHYRKLHTLPGGQGKM